MSDGQKTEWEQIESHACHGGRQLVYQHQSATLNCAMSIAVYLPSALIASADEQRQWPVMYWLSGLTCTEQNVITKSGFQDYANQYGMIVVAPDTSPRGDDVPDDEGYDLGQGAGFYVNATQTPWQAHYQMYDYIVDEVPALIESHWSIDQGRQCIAGHSMGGHGALMIGLRNVERFQSVSAFAPVAAPMQAEWGEKIFTAYLGDDRSAWSSYDATQLMTSHGPYDVPILIDQGTDDAYLGDGVRPDLFQEACERVGQASTLRYHEGYDHGYYFVSTFLADHFAFHAKACGLIDQ